MGDEFDTLPKKDFPLIQPETFETAGGRVSRAGFRALVLGVDKVEGGAACHL